MKDEELVILGKLASMVPKNGKILEIGAHYGRTTSALYHGKDPSVKLTVVDPWLSDPNTTGIRYHGDTSLLTKLIEISTENKTMKAGFEYCLSDIIHDIEVLEMFSNQVNNHNSYDFIFIDGSHEYKDVDFDISKSIVNPNTLVFGDDHLPHEFPGIRQSIFLNKKNRCVALPLGIGIKLWGLIPTEGYWRENINNIFNAMEGKEV